MSFQDEEKREFIHYKEKRARKRALNRVKPRLQSIVLDYELFLKPLIEAKRENELLKNIPVIANERCGPWYSYPISTQTCYFRSQDGHVGTYEFSTKRLNLHLLKILNKKGSCWLIDASRYKEIPDSFSRTIPIWTAVINRLCVHYRRERQDESVSDWDIRLHAPPSIISKDENDTIESLLDSRVDAALKSGVILDPGLFVTLRKPLRCVWISVDEQPSFDSYLELMKKYSLVVCVTCATPMKDRPSYYSPGSGDDEESWARKLTPKLFWKHRKEILDTETSDDTDRVIDKLVVEHCGVEDDSQSSMYHLIGSTGIHIGSRRAGRPPECWNNFDAILNVTMDEYDGCAKDPLPDGKFYLQMPVEEGKRDRCELERLLPLGLGFLLLHAGLGRRVLVHCAQGKDRSVAVVMAFICLLCDINSEDLRFIRPPHQSYASIANLFVRSEERQVPSRSGISTALQDSLLGQRGRESILECCGISRVDKATLRVAHHALARFRPEVAPARSTMQKLNRFFMSSEYTTTSSSVVDTARE